MFKINVLVFSPLTFFSFSMNLKLCENNWTTTTTNFIPQENVYSRWYDRGTRLFKNMNSQCVGYIEFSLARRILSGMLLRPFINVTRSLGKDDSPLLLHCMLHCARVSLINIFFTALWTAYGRPIKINAGECYGRYGWNVWITTQ